MRSKKLFAVVLFVVLAALGCAMSAFATTINPETDAVFTCDSDPADFNGKTFENLYVLLNGCTNFDSTIIPGQDVFVTLRDITVEGDLHYVDDTYDRATNTYRDAKPGEQLTTVDHYLNIAGESQIFRIIAECLDPHVCNLGVQYPTVVASMTTTSTTTQTNEKPRLVVRGYIDPLVDSNTNYYTDTSVKSYPDFDINTFDYDFVKTATEDINRFDQLNFMYAYAATIAAYPNTLSWFEEYSDVTEQEEMLFKRAFIQTYTLGNIYKLSGNDFVDFANIEIGNLGVENGNGYLGVKYSYSQYKWDPVFRSKGFVTVGSLVSSTSFTTDVIENNSHRITSADSDGLILPMFIDLMTIGTSGEKITYNMNNTRIAMLNYLGDEKDGSKFILKTDADGNTYNADSIGILNVMGGAFEISSATTDSEKPTIENLNFYEGNPDYQFGEVGATGFIRNTYYNTPVTLSVFTMWMKDDKTFLYEWDPINRREEAENKSVRDRRYELYLDKVFTNYNFARTGYGYFEITRALDEQVKIGNTDMSGQSKVSFYGQNVSLGNINVSKNLGDITTWMDGSCHFWQHGKQQMVVGHITE